MNALDELLERITIEFPIPITADEIEGNLFDYLREEILCDISYSFYNHGEKYRVRDIRDERYISEFTGIIRSPMVNSNFDMVSVSNSELPRLVLFKAIKFNTVPGYDDSIEEFETQSRGKEQLKLIDDVRKATKEYFSQRPK